MLGAFFYGYGCTNVVGGLLCRRFGGQPVLAVAVTGWSLFTFLLPTAATSLRLLWWARMMCGLMQGSTFAAIYRAIYHCMLCFWTASLALGVVPWWPTEYNDCHCHSRHLRRHDPSGAAGPGCLRCGGRRTGWDRLVLPARPADRVSARLHHATPAGCLAPYYVTALVRRAQRPLRLARCTTICWACRYPMVDAMAENGCRPPND